MGSEERLFLEAGNTIQLGEYAWKVLDVQNNRALLLCEFVVELRQYNRKFIDVTWETSTLRQYLNGPFYDNFSAEEKTHIAETVIQNSKNPWFDTKEGNSTKDKVFLLSLGEVVKYFGDSGCLSSKPTGTRRIDDQFNSVRIACDAEGTESWWWLRSPGFYGLNAAYVNTGGWIYVDGNNVNLYGGVRPAIWLNVSSESQDTAGSDADSRNTDELDNNRDFKEAMAKMREIDERVQIMLDATPLSCNLWNDSFNTIECNQEAVILFGLSNKQEYLDKFYELSPPFQPSGSPSFETMHENIGKAFRDGYYRFGWTHQRLDGTPIPSEITLVRVKYKNGYIVAGYTRDLREHNKMIEELELALKQATEASKAKSNFLSAMSHEMRTPMNAIIGMTAIGEKATDLEEKNYALRKINISSVHLLGVINDVLDMAKIEADKLELYSVEFNFKEMLQKVMTVVNFQADEKKQTFTVNVDKNIPEFIVGDEQRLAQIITNLTANAVKFTPEGGMIQLDISLIEEDEEICKLRIEVSDNGIGISSEQQQKIFDAFQQAENGMSREYGGTGLGLVISKNIIERMGGTIWVESKPGMGSKFIFIVNTQRNKINLNSCPISDDKSKDTEIANGDFVGKRMLIAEDVEINREILIALLEDTGMIFECATNGKEALEMVEAAPDKYDIIFMDLQMPLMDGYEATRRIRALPALWRTRLPIIALTANVFTSDIEKCFAAGMDYHLGKPIDIDKIFDVLRKYLK